MGKVRIKLITALVWAYRHAENTFNDTGNDTPKDTIDEIVNECKLTKTERNEFDKQCNIIGI